MQRAFFHFFLVALLLSAQHGALSHQIGHAGYETARFANRQNQGQSFPELGFCCFHLAFGTVLGAIDITAPASAVAANTVERSERSVAYALPPATIVPVSRGPPDLR